MFSKWMKMDEDVDSFKNLVSTIKLDEHFTSVLYRDPVFFKCFTAFECCIQLQMIANSLLNVQVIIPRQCRRDIVLASSVRTFRPHFLSVRNDISVPIGQI